MGIVMPNTDPDNAKREQQPLQIKYLTFADGYMQKEGRSPLNSDITDSLKHRYLSLSNQHVSDGHEINCDSCSTWHCVPFVMKCLSVENATQYFGYVEIFLDGVPQNDRQPCAAGFFPTYAEAMAAALKRADDITSSLAANKER
jgi:hypothetical protein